MLDDDLRVALRVTDLKQWAYCPRIFYYHHCLPRVRPTTYKMQAGIEAGRAEEGRERRRSLRTYGLSGGEREFNVPLKSRRLGLRGELDMLITLPQSGEVVPVDYKLSKSGARHFQLQLAAYGMLVEEMRAVVVRRGFLYLIPERRAQEVKIGKRLRDSVQQALEAMQHIVASEEMPPPVSSRRKCVSCEFRRFCNDVL